MNRDDLRIKSPCNADWNAMDDRGPARFCGQCQKSVHDLSAMTPQQATDLLRSGRGLCVRYSVDADGEILHRTPTSSRRFPRLRRAGRLAVQAGLGAALTAGLPALAASAARPQDDAGEPSLIELAIETLKSALNDAEPIILMGAIAEPPPQVLMGEPLPIEPPEAAMGGIEPRIEEPPAVIMGRVASPQVTTELEDDPSQLRRVDPAPQD